MRAENPIRFPQMFRHAHRYSFLSHAEMHGPADDLVPPRCSEVLLDHANCQKLTKLALQNRRVLILNVDRVVVLGGIREISKSPAVHGTTGHKSAEQC